MTRFARGGVIPAGTTGPVFDLRTCRDVERVFRRTAAQTQALLARLDSWFNEPIEVWENEGGAL